MDQPTLDPGLQPIPAPGTLTLPTGAAVQLWWMPTSVSGAVVAALRATLDDATIARVDAMVREQDRRRTILAHGLLRHLVSAGTGQPPHEVAVERHCATCDATDHGKPTLVARAGWSAPPQFNLAHSGDVVAVALAAPDVPVGVDVEAIQSPFDWAPVRRHVFTDAEWEASGTEVDPSAARFALWARKEASAKATGHGLAIELAGVSIAPAFDAVHTSRLSAPDADHDLLVVDAVLAPGSAAAIAVFAATGPPQLSVHQAVFDD